LLIGAESKTVKIRILMQIGSKDEELDAMLERMAVEKGKDKQNPNYQVSLNQINGFRGKRKWRTTSGK
jgi:hypothetical protein